MDRKTGRTGRSMARLAGSSALLALMASAAMAETQGCALVGGVLPEGCFQANQGQVVAREIGANTEDDGASAVGDLGFSISIDPVRAGGPRQTIAGDPVVQGDIRAVDRSLEDMGVQLSYDGLGAKPKLNVSTVDMRRSYVAGERVSFRAFSNYPAWIAKAEVRIRDRDGRVTLVPIAPNGVADWVMPAGGDPEMDYVLRVYDSAGRYDETAVLPLARSARRLADPELDGPIVAAGEGEDRTARRRIPVRGGAVTVTGLDVPAGTRITVMGEPVIQDLHRGFIVQRILPPGEHGVQIGVGSTSEVRNVTIPAREVFATGIVDLTLGRDLVTDKTWKRGRIAGFAQGVTADGTQLTAMVDTREDELRDLFRDFGRKHPDQVLAGIEDEDVWVTTGDDSSKENLAPTSGKLFLKVERNGSHLMWGDFKPTEDLDLVVRSDRALYGLKGEWRATETMANGEARFRFTGYAAQPDSLLQRDVFRGTGGSAYFLSRRDIQSGTETLLIETRDPVSGRVVSTRRLVEGSDYRIDYVQGLVILNAPLSPSAGAGGLLTDRPLGDYDLNLVAQYEYVPTTGAVNGVSAGGRAEVWATESLRFGLSGVQENSGAADSTLVGADVLFRHSEGTYLSFEAARSEGPGFGSSLSLNGGLEIDPATPSAGVLGAPADGLRVEGRVDLADLGGKGFVSGYFDRRDAGFSSPDLEIATAQTTYGLDGEVGLTDRVDLTFGTDRFDDAAGKERTDARLGVALAVSDTLGLELEAGHTDRSTPGSTLAEDNGTRTDLGAKLTWTRDDDLSAWVFGQATLRHAGGLGRNNRLGFGAEARLSEAWTVLGEASDGSLGAAGRLELAWAPNASSTYSLGYRLDPTRVAESATVTGRDKGTLVFGAQTRLSDRWAYTAENSYSGFGSEPSLTSTYGVTYTPSDTWRYDFGILSGENTESDGTTIQRQGLSFGVKFSGGEDFSAGLRSELRFEDSNNPARVQDRQTLLMSGFFDRRTSENWRLIGNLDAVLSDADTDNLRDGRYVEASLGYAYRPIDNDRVNALISYTYLYDLPGSDQVNVDGDVNGPKQRSHILNMGVSVDLNQQFTLGVKYGFRQREEAARGSNVFNSSQAHLGIMRLDYHVVHNWDIMAESRAMAFPKANTTEFGALVAVYRDMGDNLRLGGGYSWGGVSDDLRSMETNREGVFLNLISKF
ncbi:TonB-dependent receptor [Rhodobacter ferrooxidans]|uniref:Outer membrane autotransporter barrel domain protein n=1 Tax=Rhodobacter ferrooxidans TaxID=371731 RepID=C8RZD0_9RHOB|nr:hypothetical protein [Rhodobacter sp. SW2]EEW26087.1 conserved hypothetical protein [Rhodobacter sp. SW2]